MAVDRQGSFDLTAEAYANTLEPRDPVQARRARVIAPEVDLPPSVVESDLPGFEEQASNTRNADMLGSDPALAHFFTDPHIAAAAKDDIPTLGRISSILGVADDKGIGNIMRAPRGRLLSSITGTAAPTPPSFSAFNHPVAQELFAPGKHPFAGTPRVTRAQGLIGTLENQAASTGLAIEYGLADMFGQTEQYKNLWGLDPGYYDRTAAAVRRAGDTSQAAYDQETNFVGQVAYQAAQSLVTMGASMLTRAPVAAMALSQGLPEYLAVRQRGGGKGEAAAAGAVQGVAEYGFEKYFGLGWMLGPMGKRFAKEGAGKFISGLLLREVPSEVATTGVQDLADALTTGGEGWQSFLQRHSELSTDNPLIQTAASTALLVGALGGGHHIVNRLSREQNDVTDVQHAAAGGEFLDTLMSAAEQSKSRKEDPTVLHDFVTQRTQDSPVRNIYLPVEAAISYMQSDEYGGELDDYQQQITQAQATQGDVVIPVADAVASLSGTPAWDALKAEVRIEPGGLSRKEAAAKQDEIMSALEARGKEIAQETEQEGARLDAAGEVYVEVKNRLRVAGVDEKQADNVAQIYAARYEARAARRGGTPLEQFKASNIVFPGESVDGTQKGRQFAQEEPMAGLPREVKVDGETRTFGPFVRARQAARKIATRAGIVHNPPRTYAAVDPERGARIAQAFEEMQHNPEDPETKAAYRAMIDETIAQFHEIQNTGLKIEFIRGDDPYGNPRNAIRDVVENNHLWVYPTTAGFGSSGADVSGNPLLEKTGITIDGHELLANDVFRIVHDYFGHIMEGVGFRASGEENAWRIHSAMYSPLARRAMTTETRGQNSWVNFGPHGEKNRIASGADTVYADQKIGLLPEWVSTEGLGDRTLEQSAAIGGYEGLAPYLTSEEKAKLREDSKRKILAIAETLPDAEEMAAVAHAGRAKRGWYENSAQAILDVFGHADAPRFAALLAALSPQTSVQSNLYNALKTWTNWNEAGRPTDRRTIVEIMGRSVEGNKGVGSVLNAWINNSVTALTAADPAKVKLSGPKVDSFMNNLVGVVDEVTNDTWMANYAGLPAMGTGGTKGKTPTYKALNAVVRAAADILSKRTGELWTPAEVQETVWSLAKTVYEMRDRAGEDRTMRELLEAGHVTHDDIANTPDFGVLFSDGIYRTILEEGGYSEATQALGRNRRAVGVDGQASVAAEAPKGFSEDAYRTFLAQAAERLEGVRARRLAQSAERRGDPRQRTLFQDVLPEAGWTPERISGLVDQYSNEDGSSTAVAVMMSPDEYLGLMASARGREIISQRVNQLDEYGGGLDLATLNASPPIVMTVVVNGRNSMVRGHNGRHRMMMLKEAGVQRVPVVVRLTDEDGKAMSVTEPVDIPEFIGNRSRSDQTANGDLTGSIHGGLPINFRYQDRIAEMGERVLNQSAPAGWTSKRINDLIDQYGYFDGRTKAFATYISPEQFLDVTTPADQQGEVKAEAGALDEARLSKEQQTPFLMIEQQSDGIYQIVGHEGRHRLAALAGAGIQRVPVVLNARRGEERTLKSGSTILLREQHSSDVQGAKNVILYDDLIPITEDNRALLKERFGQGNMLFQGPRGSVTLQDSGAKIIQLFGTANRSTLLHETGHIWLEELRADATADGADAQDKADWETVQKWFAAHGSAIGKDGAIPTDAHEMWARGIERYFMEGKAPTEGLRSVFKTFRAWLLRIYQVVENLHSPITPEIREVMSRLVATQDALDEARRNNDTEPLFKSAEDAGMTDAEFADYQSRVVNARDEAYDALLFRTMEKIRRERTEEIRKERASVRAEVGEAISKQPQFRLLHLLRTGKWLGEPDRPAQPVKLNTGWLIDNYGDDILDKLPRGIQIYKASGEDGDTIAEMVGLKSGAEVVQTLLGMRAASDELRSTGETRSMRDVLIANEVDRQMAERYGDPLNDGTIEEEAIAAINSARQGEIIASEARQLAKRKHVLGTPTPYQFAREWARRTIAAGHVRDVASRAALQRYIRASNKAARAAEEAILKGDIDEAYRQKQAQLLNHALLAEAKAAAERIDKIVNRMRKLAKRAGMKSVAPEYMEKIHMLLEDYDFRPRSQRSIDEQKDFQEWLERQRDQGFEVHIPPRLENNGDPYTRVSVQELESLNDLVESLIHLGRVKQKLTVAKEERDFAEFRDEVIARIKQLPDRSGKPTRFWKSGKLTAVSPINEEERIGAAAAAELLKVETIIEELDGGPTGPLHDAIVLGATEAENKRFDLRARVLLPLAKIYHDMGRKQWKRLQERVTIPELTWNTLNEGDPRIGSPVTMTRMELLSVLLNMGNLSNLEKLSKGERWPVETLKAVIDREMTKSDFDLAQKLWDQVGLLWPDIVATEREQAGVVPEKVVNSPIETRFGTYEGGYWPVVYDAARWQLAEDMEGKTLDDMFGIKTGVATQKGHTITRTGAYGPIQLSLENVLFRHIEQVVTRIAYAGYARDVLRIVRDRSIRGMTDTKLGPEYRKQIEKWLARQVHEGAVHAKAARWWEKVLRQARINTTIVGMGFRFSTGLAQTIGLTASAQRIGAKWVGVGFKRLALSPLEGPQFVYARSPEMLHRTEAVNREVAEVARKMRGQHGFLTNAQHWAMWHIGMADRYLVAIPTWLGAHAKGMKEGMTDAEASAYADKSVRQSQGSGREKDLAAIQSTNSEAMRFWTMFYTPWNVLFNAQWQGERGLKRGDPKPFIAVTFWWLMASMLGDALLSGDWPKDQGDDGTVEGVDWGAWALRNMFFGLFAGVPFARDAANFAEAQVTGQFASDVGTTPLTRIADAVEQAWHSGKKIKKGEPVKNPIKQAGNTAGLLLGWPTGQLGTTAQFLWDVHQDEAHPQSVSDWYFGLTRDKKPAADSEDAQ